jgi:hypothetical protein
MEGLQTGDIDAEREVAVANLQWRRARTGIASDIEGPDNIASLRTARGLGYRI